MMPVHVLGTAEDEIRPCGNIQTCTSINAFERICATAKAYIVFPVLIFFFFLHNMEEEKGQACIKDWVSS